MKLIETYKSPNFNERIENEQLRYLILHYTAMKSCQEALEYMCKKESKVSAHFLISKKGEIFYLVDLKKRAWHAGKSYWKGLINLNSSSIGIEIDNSGHHIFNENYNYLQIQSLCKLVKNIIEEYKIMPENVLGHSDIAPFRKIDPGEKFPWNKLNENKLSYTPKIISKVEEDKSSKIKTNDKNKYKEGKEILSMLGMIGYDTRGVKVEDLKFKLLIQAYQRHHRQSNVFGDIDRETFKLIEQHYKDILT
tara:strand:+ start:323 stop:1072 length:750 start_codon:yes stop_codon:yes gene_type:complete